MNVLGIPFTYNEDGQLFLPKSIKDPTKDSEDMMRLIQHGALYNHITNPNHFYCCPLKLLCMKSVPLIEKDECFDFPWEGESCVSIRRNTRCSSCSLFVPLLPQ